MSDFVVFSRRLVVTLAILLIGAMAVIQGASPTLAQTTQTQPAQAQPAPAPAPAPRTFLPSGKSGAAIAAPQTAGPIDRFYIWVTMQQQAINQSLVNAIKSLKAGGGFSAALVLGGLSFMYGILHAAGPGHGKAVISAYVLADRQTLRRGVMLSFLSALVQALMALLVVAMLKFVLDASGMQATKLTEAWLERASWAFVALFGAWLLYRQIEAYRAVPAAAHSHDHGHAQAHHDHGHGHHDHKHHDHAHHGHDHAHHGHDHGRHDHAKHDPTQHIHAGDVCDTCGHAHMPSPEALQKDWSLRRMLTLAFAIGIRPCTGAILVLVFAISQGLLWAGVFATFAMAIGTAITVSALAALAVGSRGFAERFASASGASWLGGAQTAVGIGGAAFVMLTGATFLYYSLTSTATF